MCKRRKTALWFIGQSEPSLPDNVLPTTAEVLQTVYYYHKVLKKTVQQSLQLTMDNLLIVWDKAGISVALKQNIITKMQCCVDEYNLLKKNKGRESSAQNAREDRFKEKLSQLFDIAHKDLEQS